MKKIMVVFGTRPEAIKMCPVVKELRNKKKDVVVCVTGQHREMLQQVLDVFDIVPDYNLDIMREKQDLFTVTSDILEKIKEVLINEKPDIVLVHGDTTSAYASALAAFYLNIEVGHVEAGLRTYNIQSPFPEEFNRQSISLISNYHFAPTQKAADNLYKEGHKDNIYITGNTVIDALSTTIDSNYYNDYIEWAKDSKLILITAHRRENLGKPMENMFNAINRVLNEHQNVKAIYPIHMNPVVREIANKIFKDNEKIKIINPLDVVDFHNFMNASYLILTDSGGVQEEAPSLGKPVLVMRDTTERPEGIETGTLKLVGTEEENIYNYFKILLTDQDEYNRMSIATNPYGDGMASKRIVEILFNND